MSIVSHPANDAYRDNFDRIFGKREKPNACRVYNTTCPTPDLCRLGDPKAPCMAEQANDAAEEEKR